MAKRNTIVPAKLLTIIRRSARNIAIKNKKDVLLSTEPVETWVSPSSLRNYLLKDSLLDYFEMFYNSPLFPVELKCGKIATQKGNTQTTLPRTSSQNTYMSSLMADGIEYEKNIVNIIKEKWSNKFIEITGNTFEEKLENTKKAFKDQVPIIYQGYLVDEVEKIRGFPDLMIRSDFINNIFNEAPLPILDEITESAPRISLKNCHYIIVDIKNSGLHFKTNGETLLNSGSIPAYKGQLYAYTYMLGKIQGYEPKYAFIIGTNGFEKAGTIDYSDDDSSYKKETFDAVRWLRRLSEEGKEWKLLPKPSVKELYPNMCINDPKWAEVKTLYAQKLHEITMLWYCGIKHRELAHSKGIYGWNDSKLNSELMNFKDKKAQIINKMITVNRNGNEVFTPSTITNNLKNWQNTDCKFKEYFFDIETMNPDSTVFLIGIGWFDDNLPKSWMYKSFILKDLNSEEALLADFFEFINYLQNGNQIRIYHWTAAECTFLQTAINRLNKSKRDSFNKKFQQLKELLFDMKDIFTEEPIIIKGCFGFGLKEIAKKLFENKMIKVCWDETSECFDGVAAMTLAQKCYMTTKNSVMTNETFKKIVNYNEIDCHVLGEILQLLKSKVTAATNCDSDSDNIVIKKRKINPVTPINLMSESDESQSEASIKEEDQSETLNDSFIEDDDDESFDIKKELSADEYVKFGSEIAKIDEYMNDNVITASRILSSNCSEQNKVNALILFSEMKDWSKWSMEYNNSAAAIKTLIDSKSTILSQINSKSNIPDYAKDLCQKWFSMYEKSDDHSKDQRFIQKINYVSSLPFDIVQEFQVEREKRAIFNWIKEYSIRLDEKLYGMKKVKTQLIQMMIERLNNKNVDRQVLGICGPPGVGKTAVCLAHAYASNLPIYFCNIGSSTEIMQIKGSSSTYSGSDAGMITKGLVKMGISNGILVFDEIDKIVMDDKNARKVYNAMLEIWDHTQNNDFRDDFIPEIKLDLSRITHMCTLNDEHELDEILRDRIKIIHVEKYSTIDKYNIARNYFIPNMCKNFNIPNKITISDKALNLVIEKEHRTKYDHVGVRYMQKIITSSLSWINMLRSAYIQDEDEAFVELVGQEYKNYPRFEINDEDEIDISTGLIKACIETSGINTEDISHLNNMYI